MSIIDFTYALFGDDNVGKTAFLIRHQTGEFVGRIEKTSNASFRYFDLNTTEGVITLGVTESYMDEDCVGIMVMFDVSNRDSFRESCKKITKFNLLCPNTPIVWIGNKVDMANRRVIKRDIEERIMRGLKIQSYVETSAASGYNIDLPLLELLQIQYNGIAMEEEIEVMQSSIEDSDDAGEKENIAMMSDNE